MATRVDLKPREACTSPLHHQESVKSQEQRVQDLLQDIFSHLGEMLSRIRAPQCIIRAVQSSVEHDSRVSSIHRSSLLTRAGVTHLSDADKCYLQTILREHSFSGDLMVLQLLGLRMMKDWNQLAKELPKALVSLNKEEFFFSFWKVLAFYRLSKQEEVFTRTDACFTGILECDAYLNPRHYQPVLRSTSTHLEQVPESSKAKDNLVSDMRILEQLLFPPEADSNRRLLEDLRLRSFGECQAIPNRLQELSPLMDFTTMLLKIIKQKDPRAPELEPALTVFEHTCDAINKQMRRLQGLKSDAPQVKQAVDSIYLAYLQSCLEPSILGHSALIKLHSTLDRVSSQRSKSTDKKVAASWYQVSFVDSVHDLMVHVEKALRFKYNYPYFCLISRLKVMLIVIRVFKDINETPQIDTLTPTAPKFRVFFRKCSDSRLFNIKHEDSNQLWRKVREITDEHLDWNEIISVLKSPLSKEEQEEVVESDQKDTEECEALITTNHYLINIYNDLFRFLDETHLKKQLDSVYKEAMAFVNKLPKGAHTRQLQEDIRAGFLAVLAEIRYEYLLLKDLKQLLRNEDTPVEEIFPEELLKLLCFEVPGIPEDEDSDEDKESIDLVEEVVSQDVLRQPEELDPDPAAALVALSLEDKPTAVTSTPLAKQTREKTAPKPTPTPTISDEIKAAKKIRQVKAVLRSFGFTAIRHTGSHEIYKSSTGGQVVLPDHGDRTRIPVGTLTSITKQAAAALQS